MDMVKIQLDDEKKDEVIGWLRKNLGYNNGTIFNSPLMFRQKGYSALNWKFSPTYRREMYEIEFSHENHKIEFLLRFVEIG